MRPSKLLKLLIALAADPRLAERFASPRGRAALMEKFRLPRKQREAVESQDPDRIKLALLGTQAATVTKKAAGGGRTSRAAKKR